LEVGDSGQIFFESRNIARLKNRKDLAWFYHSLQVVFQHPADTFDSALTMRQNLEECYQGIGMTEDETQKVFNKMLPMLLLEPRTLDEIPRNLSGGQKQRYALLRAFGCEPSLIIADEPFTYLDYMSQSRLMAYLLERKKSKENPLSGLLISHEIGIVSKLCDRILVINDGCLVEDGPAHSVINNAQNPATQRLIQAAKMLGTI
jgi:peptide/nickel transport system ATP-binding protein